MSNPELFSTDEPEAPVTPTQIEFARLISLEQTIRTMRSHQKAFFALKSKGAWTEAKKELALSKEWEKRCDKLLEVKP